MNVDFGYCIWLTSDNFKYKHLTNGFEPHISIKTHLTLKNTKYLYNKIKNIEKIKIKILSKPIISNENGFYALYFNVLCLNDNKPLWWPSNAHISFIYKYNECINEDEISNTIDKIKDHEHYFNTIKIMLCKNYHSNWKQIELLH